MQIDLFFSLAILIMSVVIHEVSHGYAAYVLGDKTAKYQGRLTLNPIKHIDLLGSVILPLLLVISQAGFMIGWAKPVPYNPNNLRNKRWGEAIVALAGPLSNIFLAVIFGLIIRFGGAILPPSFVALSLTLVIINVVLACFNLVPIPPLDGSKILFSVLPDRFIQFRYTLEQYGFFMVLLFVLVFDDAIMPAVSFLTELFTGISISGLL